MKIKEFNSLEEIKEYYDEESNTYVFKEDDEYIDLVIFNFDLTVEAKIEALTIKARNIDVKIFDIVARDMDTMNINAGDIYARDIKAKNIDAKNIKKARDINAEDINSLNINALDINAFNIDCVDIIAKNVNVRNINARNIECYNEFVASEYIKCKSIRKRDNPNSVVLDEKSNIENEMLLNDLLKILKKRIDLEYLKCSESYEQYKTVCSYWNEITEEEFYKIKEWLE